MKRLRSAVVLIQDGKVALIQRLNERGTYYLFPGGGVEPNETIEEAAIREAREELGVTVKLGNLIAIVHFGEDDQYYFRAYIESGVFGTGKGEELLASVESETGSYRPTWLACSKLANYTVLPAQLAGLIALNLDDSTCETLIFREVKS